MEATVQQGLQAPGWHSHSKANPGTCHPFGYRGQGKGHFNIANENREGTLRGGAEVHC